LANFPLKINNIFFLVNFIDFFSRKVLIFFFKEVNIGYKKHFKKYQGGLKETFFKASLFLKNIFL